MSWSANWRLATPETVNLLSPLMSRNNGSACTIDIFTTYCHAVFQRPDWLSACASKFLDTNSMLSAQFLMNHFALLLAGWYDPIFDIWQCCLRSTHFSMHNNGFYATLCWKNVITLYVLCDCMFLHLAPSYAAISLKSKWLYLLNHFSMRLVSNWVTVMLPDSAKMAICLAKKRLNVNVCCARSRDNITRRTLPQIGLPSFLNIPVILKWLSW